MVDTRPAHTGYDGIRPRGTETRRFGMSGATRPALPGGTEFIPDECHVDGVRTVNRTNGEFCKGKPMPGGTACIHHGN